ncbi:RyR domain-containing protein [Desulfobulbus sp.]|uniref:RyR domain-containing protein n=1 Tax=Desulfobulbus sp. TaxID=895 RepID=UPI00286EFD54|nr:RyR domain-containing protein [Desulfobulbus sp.]
MSTENKTDFEQRLAEKQQRIDEQIQLFKDNQKLFRQLQNILTTTLKEGIRIQPNPAIIEGRVKEVDSFAEKCLRKWEKYNQPAWQLTDLCGVRVIVLTRDMVPPVVRFIEEHFQVLEKEDKIDQLGQSQFGYLSFHAVVALAKAHQQAYAGPDGTVPEALFSVRSPAEAAKTGLSAGPIYKAEIQVRTLLQHAWAEAAHDNLYKTEIKNKPRRLERQSALIAAQLEKVDTALVQLVEETREYQSFYGAYLSPEQIREAIAINETVLRHDPDNTQAALKIARLADCLGDSRLRKRVEQILLPFAANADASILRELGMVQWKLGKKKTGRAYLEQADQRAPGDPDTLCELGRTFIDNDQFRKALPWYERAFIAAPQYPRALRGYIECRILAGQDATLDFIALIRSNLEQAIEISLRRIRAGMHLPHAWYDIGFFQLLLGRNHESLQAYAKGVLFTASPGRVSAILGSLTEIQEVVQGRNAHLVEGLIWIRSFLRVMLVGRFKMEKPESLAVGFPELDGFTTLTPAHRMPSSPLTKSHDPIFLVAGSCSQESQTTVAQYEPMIREAFDEYGGILCCGGTEAGVSGIVGRLESKGQLKKIAYQPQGKSCMREYACVPTAAGTFSPLDPLMLWSDLLIHKIDPASVNLLGVRGGEIAAFEYRLALLLGAKVGVLRNSGGASQEIADDPDWRQFLPLAGGGATSGHTRLLVLPADQETLTAFVRQAMPSEKFNDITRESLAEAIHEHYRREQLNNKSDELAPWKDLAWSFKESNRGQADDIGAKLRRANLAVRKAEPGREKLFSFSPELIEQLAEMEHGRWVVERLVDGWNHGEQRDNEKKTRPQLVPWHRLPESEKQKDRDAVAKIPELLRQAGYEIVVPD